MMSEKDEQRFQEARQCHICEKSFAESCNIETSDEQTARLAKKDIYWNEKKQELGYSIPSEDFTQRSDSARSLSHKRRLPRCGSSSL